MDCQQLLDKALKYLPPEKVGVIGEACKFASEAHQGQTRASGEPYLEHPLHTAIILADLQLDSSSLAAAILHDISEDCGVDISEIETRFGAEIARLVDGVTKLDKVVLTAQAGSLAKRQAENLRKMLMAMAEDLRVVFIKLADRLHNMRTLAALTPDQQQRISQETMEIYAPLAHRLGIWELKWQLEDLAFSYLQPHKYRRVARLVAARRTQRETFINQVIEILHTEFGKIGLKIEISGRPKHIYSIHQKMERYATQGKPFDEILDLLALRVLATSVPECYTLLGIIHSLWHPLPEAFDDYIANPKPNGYRALHTAVMAMGTTPLEIQIRTHEMHFVDEYGVAAHWRYKEGSKEDIHFEEKLGWLRQMVDWHRELSGAEEFLESVKADIFIDQVFVYTPKGEIIDLPRGATPLDFAYRVHTELGHRCVGSKINGKLVTLNYTLKNGDVVEIISSKADKGPSRDWLNPHLGFVKTSHGKTKIRQWFSKQERSENIERGREILDKELKQLGVKIDRQLLSEMFNYPTVDDFLAALGYGGVTSHQLATKLAINEQPAPEEIPVTPHAVKPKQVSSDVRVLGVGDLTTTLAQCCNPVPGDKIIGYITRNKGVTIHRHDCYNITREENRERLVSAEWGETSTLHPINMRVEAWNRVGLMRDITTVVAEEKVNISTATLETHDDNTISVFITIEIKGLPQLSRLIKKIEAVKGITSISREIGGSIKKPAS